MSIINTHSKLIKKNNIFCLKVSGSPYQIGFQQGQMLKEYLKDSVYQVFSKYTLNTLKSSTKIKSTALATLVNKFLNKKSQQFINKIPNDLKEEIKGFCEGANISYSKYLECFVFPETINYLIHRGIKYNYATNTHLSGAELLGCSSFAVKGRATENGELIFGRNFDSFGLGFWDKYPLVAYVEPENGFKYVNISSVGINPAVITGMNEEKITYALHKNYTSEYSEENLPILALGNLVLKNADSIEKAIEIIKTNKSNSGWSIFLTDGKSKETCVVEICCDKVKIRKQIDDVLVCTNSYLSPDFHDYETVINPIFNISSNTRYQRITTLCNKHFMSLNVEKVSQILGDRYDLTSEEEKIYGYTISKNDTVSSVIFSPEKNNFWVAGGTVPVCNSDYEFFTMNFDDIAKNEGLKIPTQFFSTTSYNKAWKFIYEAHLKANEKDYKEASKLIAQSIDICGINEPVLYFVYAMLRLKLYDYEVAKDFFQKAYDNESDIYKSGIIKIWLGRIYDLLGDRAKAIRQYRYAEQMNKKTFCDLVELSIKGQKSAYKKSYIKYITLDVAFGEEIKPQ